MLVKIPVGICQFTRKPIPDDSLKLVVYVVELLSVNSSAKTKLYSYHMDKSRSESRCIKPSVELNLNIN